MVRSTFLLAAVIAAVGMVCVACGAFMSSSGPDTTPPDGNATDGAGGDVAAPVPCPASDAAGTCPAGTTCIANMCVPGCADHVIYVSGDNGKDGNDGCSTQAPLRTIGAALALVSTENLTGHEIHVCRGTYAEHAPVLDHPVSLRGGYNCLTWTRADDGFGADGGFHDPNETIIQNGDYATRVSTFDVVGTSITSATVLDGLTFDGPPTGAASGVALLVRDGAAPTISNAQIFGGATSATDFGSIGLRVQGDATPTVVDTHVIGGAGTSVDYGSLGIVITGGGMTLSRSVVEAGTGGGRVGATGIYVSGTKPTTIDSCKVLMDGSTATAANGQAYLGVIAAAGPVDLSRSLVLGKRGTCQVGNCSVTAVQADPSATTRVWDNVLYAGDLTASSNAATIEVLGFSSLGSTNTEITGNVIHAGGTRSTGSVIALGLNITSSALMPSINTAIVGNTIIFGAGNTTTGYRTGILIAGTPGQSDGAKALSIIGNLFVGSLFSTEIGIDRWTCAGPTLAKVASNAFVSVTQTARDLDCATQAITPYAGPKAMDVAFGVSLGDRADISFNPACAADPSCSPCANAAACSAAVFQAWDAATGDVANVASAAGFRLKTGGSCGVARGLYALPAYNTSDLYGVLRSTPLSIGAAQSDGVGCTTP